MATKSDFTSCIWKLDRDSRVGLADQLVSVIKTAIMLGKYAQGEALPSILQIAKEAGCGAKTVRTAFRRLADEGWIAPRRHVGSVVLERGSGVVRGRVLFFSLSPFYCYYSDQMVAELRTRLLRGGYGISTCAAGSCVGSMRFFQLQELLKERWDLVVEHGMDPVSRKMIEDSGWPFAIVGNGRKSIMSNAPNCVGVVGVICGLALPEFVRDCAKKRVRSVLQVHCHKGGFDATEMLGMMGVDVRTERTPWRLFRLEDISRAGFNIVERLLSGNKTFKMPELILFTDDYVAQGGLIALKKHGIRIPEDVFVVTLSNKGHGPIWEVPLTRFEMDVEAHGAVVAKAIKAYLSGKEFPKDLVLGSVYRIGETF